MSDWILSWKPGFSNDLMDLQSRHRDQVLAKIRILESDPHPDGHAKKKLKHLDGKLHRLRSGDFRIFYTYDDTHVSVLKLSRRDDDTYGDTEAGDFLGAGRMTEVDLDSPTDATPTWEKYLVPAADQERPLPEPVTKQLLDAIEVPASFHRRLLEVTTQEQLLACPGVPDECLLAIDRHMFDLPIQFVIDQPTLTAPGGVDDLLRYTQGELVGFLLRLNPEQEKYVTWATAASGPTLVKGGPGTGKSTVAIYRTREMLRVLRDAGVAEPHILFTTYTNALVTSSRQLLRSLLGDDAVHVDVRTTDSLVGSVLSSAGRNVSRPNASQRENIRTAALDGVSYIGNALQQSAQARTVENLGRRYLFEEIESVIQARGITELDAYLGADRPGRRVPLQAGQRKAVWAVAESYAKVLDGAQRQTWEQARATAAALASAGESGMSPYDAVIVDEAQDLDASALRLLVEVCAEPNRLFVTADVNQSIHSAGFSWRAVHDDLKFVGRTGIFRANHRSTKEITEAARDHLACGIDDALGPDEQAYVHSGPMPAVRSRSSLEEEADLIARYLKGATKDQRLTIGSGAVLVPDQYVGKPLVEALEERGVPAEYKDSRSFELSDNFVTVLPLTSAKGLEFPVVAIAGFARSKWPHVSDLDGQAEVEALIKARRTLFVAMTRAMRTLLVVVPTDTDSMLFDGFDPDLWNTE